MNILMVLTSHDELGDTGEKTGFWLEEFAAPYYVFLDAGANITLASPLGGKPPIDERSQDSSAQTDDTKRFKEDDAAQEVLANTVKLSEINSNEFDAIFYPGGHGPLWDLAESSDSIKLIEDFNAAGKPISAVCHAPAVFKNVMGTDGKAFVSGRKITGFTNSEEDAVGLKDVVPFLLEDALKKKGAHFSKADDFNVHTVVDGNLVTGQNPPSSKETAKELLKLL
jgi:putative intracellular protease/amidase